MSLNAIIVNKDSIYDKSKRRFNINERSRDLTTDHIHLKFIFVAYENNRHHRSLYNCYEPSTIDEITLFRTRKSSIYQRACIADHITSLANDFINVNYKF